MRRVLMVSPHFPPDSSAASHRVRLLAPHLPEAGWTPTVLTVDESAYEGRLDRDLAALVPATVRVERAGAWLPSATRPLGFGDLGIRAFTGLRRACRALLARERFDALFITIYPTYPALFGPGLKRRFDVPFVLDYQDPWVGAWGRTVGGGQGGRPDVKSRSTRRIGEWLEPFVLAATDGISAVSQGTIDGIVERIPAAARLPHEIVPLGFEPADFAAVNGCGARTPAFAHNDGLVHLCYVGTLLPTGFETLRLLLRGLDRARHEDPSAARLRLHFVGTSNQSDSDAYRVLPIARHCGVEEVVTEVPGRVDYLDALATLTRSSAILLLGSSERHYTASKLYPALLAKRPILALFHDASSVVSMLRAAACEPTVRIVTYGDERAGDDQVNEVACHLRRLATDATYRAADVSLDRAGEFSARSLARRLGSLLDRVAA
ncbi:MAG TPA: glycosyltransferase [Vicinamibacterales bacterium]|nr:glycosyltransferase [Vicinamibacterales bacterium]